MALPAEHRNPITESEVKRSVLQFLKTYYKYRPRGESETIARLDMRAEGGIIADGHLAFQKMDGSPFMATFEATGYHTRDEVQFRVQDRLLIWDSLTAASLLTASALYYFYIVEGVALRPLGLWGSLAVVWLGLVLFFFGYRLLFRSLQRYRYIYAIEQFKRYHAEEQWVTVAEDVFSGPYDPYLVELKRQCISQGFGLIMVDEKRHPHLVITPARQELFNGRRPILHFAELDKWREQKSAKETAPVSWRDRLRRSLRSVTPESVLRFQRSYHNQWLIIGLCTALVGTILYLEFKDPEVQYADEEFRITRLLPQDQAEPEPLYYFIDSAFLDQFGPPRPAREVVTGRPKIVQPPPEEEAAVPPEEESELIAETDAGEVSDCARFYNLDGPKYLVVYGIYPDQEEALEQLDELRDTETEVNLLWLGCFDRRLDRYALFMGLIYNSVEEAEQQRVAFDSLLVKGGLTDPPLQVRALMMKEAPTEKPQ